MEYYSTLAKRRRLGGGSSSSTAAAVLSASATTISPDDQNQEITVHAPSSNNNYDVINTLHHTHNTSYSEDDDDDDSDDELLGQMMYQSSRTAQLLREQAAVAQSSVAEHQIGADAPEITRPQKKKKRIRKSFEQRTAELRAYKEKHGHANVKKSEDKSLYTFCANMRQARNNPGKSTMLFNEERIASLDALGFEWSMNNGIKSFEQRMDDLKTYKEKHGHVNVKRSDDKSLYQFCNNIRLARNRPEKSNMALTADRIASLDALGFDWKMR